MSDAVKLPKLSQDKETPEAAAAAALLVNVTWISYSALANPNPKVADLGVDATSPVTLRTRVLSIHTVTTSALEVDFNDTEKVYCAALLGWMNPCQRTNAKFAVISFGNPLAKADANVL